MINNITAPMITAPNAIISHISINGSEIKAERLTLIVKHKGITSNNEIDVEIKNRFLKNLNIKYTNHKKAIAISDIRIPIATNKF